MSPFCYALLALSVILFAWTVFINIERRYVYGVVTGDKAAVFIRGNEIRKIRFRGQWCFNTKKDTIEFWDRVMFLNGSAFLDFVEVQGLHLSQEAIEEHLPLRTSEIGFWASEDELRKIQRDCEHSPASMAMFWVWKAGLERQKTAG